MKAASAPWGRVEEEEEEGDIMQTARGCPQHRVTQVWGTLDVPASHGSKETTGGERG